MADNEREFKIKISTDASATVEGAAQAAEGLKQLGTAGVKAGIP